MRELLILRHAKSSWANPGMRDHQRPLNERGRRAAARMGRLVHEEDLVPDIILSSDSTRTKETVKLFSETARFNGPIHFTNDLYHASSETLLEAARDAGEAQRVLLVAHNPGMEDLVELCGGRFEVFPTAALAHVQLEIDSWNQVNGAENTELLNLWRPKNLPD